MTRLSNKSPTLADLPAPPPGRTGWPWTEESPPMPAERPDGEPWPRISIITPSYNQGRYLEETIRSVLLQGYPDFEYFVIDGGSDDESVEIIRKYEKWLSGWVSEKDSGQSEAINKGFAKCTGEIFNWLCSDDVFAKGCFATVAAHFTEAAPCDVLAGACFNQFDDEPERSGARPAMGKPWEATPYADGVWQPSCFWRRTLVGRKNLVLRDLHYCMDRELWCHLLPRAANWRWTDEVLGIYRYTGGNKSVVGKRRIIEEVDRIYRICFPETVPLPAMLRAFWLPYVLKSMRHGNPLVRLASRGFSKAVAGLLLAFYPQNRVRTLQHEFYLYSVW